MTIPVVGKARWMAGSGGRKSVKLSRESYKTVSGDGCSGTARLGLMAVAGMVSQHRILRDCDRSGPATKKVTARVAYGLRNPEVCDQAIWVGVQGLQDIPALLPGRRQQRAAHGKLHRPVHGAEAAGDLLA